MSRVIRRSQLASTWSLGSSPAQPPRSTRAAASSSGNPLVLEFLVVLLAPLLLVALGRLELALDLRAIGVGLAGCVLALLRRTHHAEAADEQNDGGDAQDDPGEHAAILRRPAGSAATS